MSEPIATYKGPIFSLYVTTLSRIKSFPELDWTKDIIDLHAKCGLFYLSEKVICFYCGARIKTFEDFESHKMSSHCTFIKLNFPKQVRTNRRKCFGLIVETYQKVVKFLQDNVGSCPSKDQFQRDLSCKICLVDLAQYVYLPCGHLVVCLECSTTQHTCPLCRKEIISILKVFV